MPISRSFLPPPERWRRTLRAFGFTALFCVGVAAALTVLPDADGFWRNLLFSECIGLWAVATGSLVRHLPWLRGLSARTSLLLSWLLGMSIGYVLGYATAYSVLGEPVQIAGLSGSRPAAIAATVVAAGFVTYLVWVRNRLSDESAARSLAQRLATDAELRMLRAQLEPHMLFNTLANLRSLVDEDPRQAQRMIDALITYLRGALVGSRTETTTLQGEFAQLAAYLEIMTLRLGARLHYRLELPAELQQAGLPSMLLQPLVENAVKHGIEPKIGGGSVSVVARADGPMLEIVVRDTGLGLPPDHDDTRPGTSYGLVHVRDRLRTLFGARASLRLERDSPQGTRAIVRIPR